MKAVDFLPPRRRGTLLHSLLLVFLAGGAMAFALLASVQPVGAVFALYIGLAVLFFSPLPIIAYRLYALQHSSYALDRDRLTLTWGLRVEEIPISDIEWVRPLAGFTDPLPLPFLALPGAVLGTRRMTGLGAVEFLASDPGSLLVLAAGGSLFAISPEDNPLFLQNIQRTIEMGSLSPAIHRSVRPSFLVVQAWSSQVVRFLWLAGLFLNIGMMAWVGLMVPSLVRISLGFLPSGQSGSPVPAAGLLLLPAVSTVLYLLGWAAGLGFHRRADYRPLAYLLWGSGVFSTLVFLVGVVFIVTTPA